MAGAITTGLVIVLGIAIIAPVFLQPPQNSDYDSSSGEKLPVLLAFSVAARNNDTSKWCLDLSNVLKKQDVAATVFVTGEVAEKDPACVTAFGRNVDIGSQTYSYATLPSIPDYTIQLQEVTKGKEAVDRAGGISSRLFKAPRGITDENIYSLLNRSGILADFSYQHQYNKYYNGKFLKFDAAVYNETTYPFNSTRIAPPNTPVLVNFDSSTPVDRIDAFITHLKSSNNLRFVSASGLTGLKLTNRSGSN